MAEAEARILTDYLIVPASLPGIVTFEQFQSFFPTLTRNSPLLRSLWKDLRSQRDIAIDHVAAAIDLEAERGKVMRREVMRQRRDVTAEEIDGEIELERALFAGNSGVQSSKHSLDTVLPELEGAAYALEADMERLGEEEKALTESIAKTVGSLSDLRYSKLANTNLPRDVRDALQGLQKACQDKS